MKIHKVDIEHEKDGSFKISYPSDFTYCGINHFISNAKISADSKEVTCKRCKAKLKKG